MSESKAGRVGFAVLGVAVLGFVVVLIWLSQRDDSAKGAEKGAQVAKERERAPLAPAPRVGGAFADGRPTWTPGTKHYYGEDPDPFVRQPQDYDMDTPKILGNRISYHVYDMETVVDMVSRGMDKDSEIGRVKGRPITELEREDAREVLQRFFDETVPNVDSMIEGSLNIDDGYALIGPRRQQMNRDLRASLGLDEDQFYKLWPQMKNLDENIDDLREPTLDELAEREAMREP